MAITPLTTPFKGLTFDGASSLAYGVQIFGEGVFNAPERDVEMITIPGRNGTFALDNGRFNNILVTYPANIIADNAADFAQAVSDFRNQLCSRKGYCRLSDDYHPDEYRMAVYKSGLEVDEKLLRTGEFDITFECKPQRWLTSGETATAVANNGTLTNPTPFEASPLLAIKGYGTIGFNGYEIELENEILGHIVLKSDGSLINVGTSYPLTFAGNLLNNGDTITIGPFYFPWGLNTTGGAGFDRQKATLVSNTGITGSSATVDGNRNANINIPSLTFTKGTPTSYSNTTVVSVALMNPSSSCTAQLVLTISYDGANTITISATDTYSVAYVIRNYVLMRYNEIIGESTKSILGNPTYVDCDLGDAYKIENDEYISLNHKVDLGSDLPKLVSGSNTVTYDNTVTELKITPRWWKV